MDGATEAGLPPGFENGDSNGIRQVKAALAGQHGQAQSLLWRKFRDHLGGQATGFPTKDKNIVIAQYGRKWAGFAACRHCQQPTASQCCLTGGPVGVVNDTGVLVIIQSGPPQALVGDDKAQWFNEMQLGAGIGAQANDVAGVGGDFRLIEDDGEHAWKARVIIKARD